MLDFIGWWRWWWHLELYDVQSSSQIVGQIVTTNKPIPSFFTVRMPFLSPNQQCQSTEGNVICIWSVFDWLVNCSWWLYCWKRNHSILCTNPSNTNSRTSSLVTLSLSSLRCRFLPVRMLIYRFQFFLTSRLRIGIEVLCRSCICHKNLWRFIGHDHNFSFFSSMLVQKRQLY